MPISLGVTNETRNLYDLELKTDFGIIDRDSNKIIEVLQKEVIVHLFVDSFALRSEESLESDQVSNVKSKKPSKFLSFELCAILYGPAMLFEDVGTFVAKCRMYLQHPRHCNRNVPYRNPHCLSSKDGRVTYTFDLADQFRDSSITLEHPINPIDLFADATLHDKLADTDTPSTLSTGLYKHQKQALTSMMQREQGWSMDGSSQDIWREEQDYTGRVSYRNVITGLKQWRIPDQFRGGLLTDAPGLGKSLCILALVASGAEKQHEASQKVKRSSNTLIVVPKTRKEMTLSCRNLG